MVEHHGDDDGDFETPYQRALNLRERAMMGHALQTSLHSGNIVYAANGLTLPITQLSDSHFLVDMKSMGQLRDEYAKDPEAPVSGGRRRISTAVCERLKSRGLVTSADPILDHAIGHYATIAQCSADGVRYFIDAGANRPLSVAIPVDGREYTFDEYPGYSYLLQDIGGTVVFQVFDHDSDDLKYTSSFTPVLDIQEEALAISYGLRRVVPGYRRYFRDLLRVSPGGRGYSRGAILEDEIQAPVTDADRTLIELFRKTEP